MGKSESEDKAKRLAPEDPVDLEELGLGGAEELEGLVAGLLVVRLPERLLAWLDQVVALGAWGQSREEVASRLVQQGLRELHSKRLITWPNAEPLPAPELGPDGFCRQCGGRDGYHTRSCSARTWRAPPGEDRGA